MAMIKLLRFVFGFAVFPLLIWAVVSLFRGDFAGLGLALLGAFVGFALWAACHRSLERQETAAAFHHRDEAVRAIRALDWEGAEAAARKSVSAIRASYSRDRGQPEFAAPYGVLLLVHALTLGSVGDLEAARDNLDKAARLMESRLQSHPEFSAMLMIIDQLQRPYADVLRYRDYAYQLAMDGPG